MAASDGRTDRHPVRQVVPKTRARAAIDACLRRGCLTAHQHARTVSSARGG